MWLLMSGKNVGLFYFQDNKLKYFERRFEVELNQWEADGLAGHVEPRDNV